MAASVGRALSKIEAVLPRAELARDALARLGTPPIRMRSEERERIDRLDAACREHRVVEIAYVDAQNARSTRRLQPLGLWFRGTTWTLVAWCELRQDFRLFRIDRMASPHIGDETFEPSPGRGLARFLARTAEEEGCEMPPDPFA